ncbi:MAG: ATP-binding protein [Sphingobacteriales bacterium]|nr:MAG: ATP-binding protein [Sphingobacteriales bacterium]
MDLTHFAKTNWRSQNRLFGIKDEDRLQHIFCFGKTGVGKSTLLLTMAVSDIVNGKGVAVLDPHGDLAETLLNYIPEHRIKDVIYFDASDLAHPITFNPLHSFSRETNHILISGMLSSLKKIWSESWGPRLEYILRYCLLSLLQYPNATLLHIQPLLTNNYFRQEVLEYVKDDFIHRFWFDEFERYSPSLRSEAISPILNKVGVFASCEPLRNIIGQAKSTFNFSELMNEDKIFIANLSKGIIGEDVSKILGCLLISHLQVAALGRASIPIHERNPFYAYIDEAQNYLTDAIGEILSEARKFRLSLFLTNQYLDQIDDVTRAAIFGNVGTIICFRTGAEDALYLAKEFYPTFSEHDFINLPKYSIYLKLMIDGVTSKPFSAITFPLPPVVKSFRREIITSSKAQFGAPTDNVKSEFIYQYAVNRAIKPRNLFEEEGKIQ